MPLRTSRLRHLLVSILALLVALSGTVLVSGGARAADPGGDRDAALKAQQIDAEPGTISGQVRFPDDGPEGYGSVTLFEYQGGGFIDVDAYGVESDDPRYSFTDLASGTYYLSYSDDNEAYRTVFSGGAENPPVEVDDAGTLTLAPGQELTTDLEALLPPGTGTLTGTVTNAEGAALRWISVQAASTTGNEYSTDTDSTGGFSLALPAGTYDLTFIDYDEEIYETLVRQDFVVADGTTTTLPTVVMPRAGSGSITGRVLTPAGTPLANAEVELWRLVGSVPEFDDAWDISWTSTDADGRYTFTGVRTGSDRHYTVAADAVGRVRTFLGGASDPFAATPLTVSASAATQAGDLTLTQAATVSGTVTASAGRAAADVYVELHRWNPVSEEFEYAAYGDTDSDGTYAIEAGPGSYTLYFDPQDSALPLQARWWGGTVDPPAGPTGPGVFEVADPPTDVVRNMQLPRSQVVTGTVRGPGGEPLSGATVTTYVWEDDYFSQDRSTRTSADGSYELAVASDTTVTLRFSRGGYRGVFLGSGSSLPESPDSNNSVSTGTADVVVPAVTLQLRPSQLGKVAGQDLAWCRAETVAANDDGSSAAIPMPFPLRFFGTAHERMFVNNNGNVTFGSSLSEYTPSDLEGPTEVPIIAPFFADVDTRGDSNQVTYGTSPDGTSFCVNWADVGYFSQQTDKLNTFQLILRSAEDTPGRAAGDFDILFNYDEILWETGSASGGSNGFGGTSAAVGFSAGTGVPGSFVQLPGSFENGALLDGGARSLVAGSQGSGQQGRYLFEVRNEGHSNLFGELHGSVEDGDGDPVTDAYVQVCSDNGTGCSYTETGTNGTFAFAARVAGAQVVRVWPTDGNLFPGGGTATVRAGEVTVMEPIVLEAPVGMPPNVTLDGQTGDGSVPSIYYGDPLPFRVTGCAGVAAPTYTVVLEGRVVRGPLPLAEGPAGVYTATIAPLYPLTGSAEIRTNVPATCGGQPTAFNVYIDPSGTVSDQWGRPVAGATVTLLRSDTFNGDYTVVPDGSDIMSPSNRRNPDTTDTDGFFRWDVTVGWYKVQVDAPGCVRVTTAAMEVPPERIDLVIKLTCASATAPVPTTAPRVSGTARVGETITATAATWSSPLVESQLVLLRNGVALPGLSHRVTASDVGAVFTARSTAQRPDYVDPGQEITVTFDAVTATSAPVTGVAAPAQPQPPTTGPQPQPGPQPPTTGPQPMAGSSLALKATKKKVRLKKKAVLKVTLKVGSGGSTTGRVEIRSGKKVVARVTLKAGARTVKIKIKGKKLKKGKHVLQAYFGGNASTKEAVSKKVKLRVVR